MMVRRFPADDNPLIHPAISFSLLAAGMAAAITIITTLCGARCRKRSPSSLRSPPASHREDKPDRDASPTPTRTTATLHGTAGEPENETNQMRPPIRELPLPPKMQQITNSGPLCHIAKSASERKLNYMRSMSIKVPRSLSMVKNRDQKEDGRQRKKEKTKVEDSIWTKTIILGEKCRVPADEEEAVIYDGKGKKVTAYHPRAPSSMSVTISRQSSFVDPDVLPNPEPK